MNKIDIDKFICSYLSILEKRKEHTKGIEGLKISGRYQLIIDLLKQQGIIYEDGSLIKIGSKKCEGKLKEMLDEKVLANSCESCKDEHKIVGALRIEKDKWYMCLHPSKGFVKGRCYKAICDGHIMGDNAYDYVGDDPTDFRLATEEEIKGKVGNSDNSEPLTDFEKCFEGMCCDKNKQFARERAKQLMLVARQQITSEVDIDKMVGEYRKQVSKEAFASDKPKYGGWMDEFCETYREGIADTLELIKKG